MSLCYRFWRQSLLLRSKKLTGILLLCLLSLFALVLAACSSTGTVTPGAGNNAAGAQATPGPVALSSLHWCSKPSMVFRDQADPNAAKTASPAGLGPANGTPTALNDWNTVKSNLGFVVFLPKTLPAGSCLLNVSGSLRDPIFGSNFTITYVLPDQSSVSFSQAPLRTQRADFQCNISNTVTGGTANKGGTPSAATTPEANANPVQLCNGVRDKTNIVFSARGTTTTLQQFFQNLQPDVNWTPAQ